MPERSDSQQTDSRTPLLKFFDSFLQERNIKWMLGVGVLLLLGSSLRLVTTQWEILLPVWRYLIILGYTGVIHVTGQWCYHHMVIRKTGTMLMALTVLLMPISFVALNWVQTDTVGLWSQPVNLVLLMLNLGFSAYAAHRIFGHFLRGPQPTFVASYLILCLAGALVPGMESAWSIWTAMFLWAAFALGSVKVNRHIFWLTEEHSYPRIFGFFPIALLGGQFFWLFAFYLAPHVELEWIGLGCVLAALPVMLTADTIARVYQQRTGDIVRPLPWSIMLPLGVGILLCFSGLCLAATELPFGMAIAPTAILSAVIMALVARRTGKQGFVWASLICVMLAYNFCHVYFAELRDLILQKGAQAVREERLPFAFYGLTYLPLISACIALGSRAKRVGNKLLAQPVQIFVIALSAVLLLGAFGHVKALFPVAAVMTIVFVVEAIAFDNRSLILPAMTAWLVAAFGLPAFADTVLGISAMSGTQISCLAIASALLLVPGFYIDLKSEMRIHLEFGKSDS